MYRRKKKKKNTGKLTTTILFIFIIKINSCEITKSKRSLSVNGETRKLEDKNTNSRHETTFKKF